MAQEEALQRSVMSHQESLRSFEAETQRLQKNMETMKQAVDRNRKTETESSKKMYSLQADVERYKASTEYYRKTAERYKAETERYKAETERYMAQTERYKAETEQVKADAEQFKADAKKYKANCNCIQGRCRTIPEKNQRNVPCACHEQADHRYPPQRDIDPEKNQRSVPCAFHEQADHRHPSRGGEACRGRENRHKRDPAVGKGGYPAPPRENEEIEEEAPVGRAQFRREKVREGAREPHLRSGNAIKKHERSGGGVQGEDEADERSVERPLQTRRPRADQDDPLGHQTRV